MEEVGGACGWLGQVQLNRANCIPGRYSNLAQPAFGGYKSRGRHDASTSFI